MPLKNSLKFLMFLIFIGLYHDTAGQTAHPLKISLPTDAQFKIYTRSYGTILGIQRGRYTFIDLGFEYHWRKITLVKPKLYSVGGNFEYNFWDNVLGYKAAFFTKQGRIALTYGAHLLYYTDFDHSRYGIGPALGFRLLGFHLVNGYNFLFGSKELSGYNTLYIALRYYFPLENKIKFRKSH